MFTFVVAAAPPTAEQSGQHATGAAPARATARPRHVSGHPDLAGVWRFATVTPLQRPAELTGKERFASAEEAAAYAARAALNLDKPPSAGDPGAYNQFRISFRPATDGRLTLTERLRRVDADTLEYRFTVDDPTVWTKPWTAIVEMTRTNEQIYEFACHEGIMR